VTIEGPRRDPMPGWAVLSWVASFYLVGGQIRQAETCLGELMASAPDGWGWQA
jgi:hypothetical protein